MRIMVKNLSDWGFFCSTMEFKNLTHGWVGGQVGAVKSKKKHNFEGSG